jgi:hypothetical protein
MGLFEGREFHDFDDRDSRAVFSNLEFRRCHFESCTLSITQQPFLRSSVQNVRLIDCSQRGSSLNAAIVQDVLVDGFRTNNQLFQTWGAVFNRVVLRGRIDRLMISNDVLPSVLIDESQRSLEIEAFRAANAEFYRHVEWALDISQGEFKELDIRNVPTHLIRRDAETQVVVTRERASMGRWKELNLKETLWRTWIHYFLQSDESSTVLVAPKRHAKFRNLLEDLKVLREAGVVEPD